MLPLELGQTTAVRWLILGVAGGPQGHRDSFLWEQLDSLCAGGCERFVAKGVQGRDQGGIDGRLTEGGYRSTHPPPRHASTEPGMTAATRGSSRATITRAISSSPVATSP